MRSQETPDIFCKKGLSWRPNSNQGLATELAWRFIAFLVGDTLGYHNNFKALTMHALCFHGVHNLLTAC